MVNEQTLNEEALLEKIFGQSDDDDDEGPSNKALAPSSSRNDARYNIERSHYSQWQVGPFGSFRPATKTVTGLPAGAYTIEADRSGLFLSAHRLMSDDIVLLPDSANVPVLKSIRTFWQAREKYTKRGLLFKRGILMYGPPGSGKTVSITMLTRELIDNDGIVVYCTNPRYLKEMLGSIRRIEPSRPLIVVLEDIDEILREFGEHDLLSILDGEHQTDNCVCLATTNYLDRLAPRIVNRPSRFDERVFVDMPSSVTRCAYLEKSAGTELSPATLEKWVKDTGGFSIAHLRELIASVLCLDQPYDEVLKRLKAMTKAPSGKDLADGYAPKQSIGLVAHD